jgi:ABC-2 type transport system ATP-binding protein
MALTADHLLVLGRGRLIADTGIEELVAAGADAVRVRAADRGFGSRLRAAGAGVRPEPGGAWLVTGLAATAIGRLAAEHGVALGELTPRRATLEEAFLDLTRDSVEYSAEYRADGAAAAGAVR